MATMDVIEGFLRHIASNSLPMKPVAPTMMIFMIDGWKKCFQVVCSNSSLTICVVFVRVDKGDIFVKPVI